ncbi:MAG: DUF1801 domain-containing protein [Candidatus Dojkabacteria bacterium]
MIKDQQKIFGRIKDILKEYSNTFTATTDSDQGYELYTNKPMEMLGRKFPRMYFAAVKNQKNFVGFYYMPIYAHPEMLKSLTPELVKCLKGKTCFHIKKDDEVLYLQIKEALDKGEKAYKEWGWI